MCRQAWPVLVKASTVPGAADLLAMNSTADLLAMNSTILRACIGKAARQRYYVLAILASSYLPASTIAPSYVQLLASTG